MAQTQNQTQNNPFAAIENIGAIIGPDGIQTSNEVKITRQTWVMLFAFVLFVFLLFVVIPKLLIK